MGLFDSISRAFGQIIGTTQAASAAKDAAATQAGAAQAGIDEQRRQFDAIKALLQPFITAGTGALSEQQDMLGLNGIAAQQQSIYAIQNGAQFQALQQQGINGILQNASATGGLRGGNVQGAIAQFSPQLLQQLINQQYSNLGGLTAIGQNAAAGSGNAGMQSASNIANLLQQQGAAIAGGQIAAGNQQAQTFNSMLKIGSTIAGF